MSYQETLHDQKWVAIGHPFDIASTLIQLAKRFF